MIINKCDLCNNVVGRIDTIILYKNKFDYCDNCKEKAEKIKEKFTREIDFENTIFDNTLRNKERKILKEVQKK